MQIEVSHLKTDEMPAVIMGNEESKRMRDMSRMFGGMDMGAGFPESNTLVLNTGNSVIKKMSESSESESKNAAVIHIYELALLAAGKLEPKALGEFVRRSGNMLEKTVSGDNPKEEEKIPEIKEVE